MEITVADFFKAQIFDSMPSSVEQEKVEALISFAKSMSEITYESIYIVDYYTKRFLYVSNNPIFLCGLTAEEVLQEGFSFYLKHVPKEDLRLLLKINDVGFEFFKDLKYEEKIKYVISYDFHLKQRKGGLLLINHRLKPIFIDEKGNAHIAICVVSVSPNTASGNVKFDSKELDKHFTYDLESGRWAQVGSIKLNSREIEILLLSAQGLRMSIIAERLFLSIDTIKFHKKNIFSKLKVNSIAEALATSMLIGAI